MRDDDNNDLISDDDGDAGDENGTINSTSMLDKNQRKFEARRKLERLKEHKELRKQLGDDWSDDLLDDDVFDKR